MTRPGGAPAEIDAKTLLEIIRTGGWAEMAAAYNKLSRTTAPLDPSLMADTVRIRRWLRRELAELKAIERRARERTGRSEVNY